MAKLRGYMIDGMGTRREMKLGKAQARFGTVYHDVVSKNGNELNIRARVEYFGPTVNVRVHHSGTGDTEGDCSRCGQTHSPVLCRHAIAALVAYSEDLAVEGGYPDYRFHLDIDRRKRVVTCDFSFVYHDFECELESPLDLIGDENSGVPDAAVVGYTLTRDYGFERIGNRLVLPLRGYNTQKVCKSLGDDFARLARFGKVTFGSNLENLAYYSDPGFSLSLAIRDGAFHVDLKSKHVPAKEMGGYASCFGLGNLWWNPVFYSAKNNAMVLVDPKVEEIFSFLRLIAVKPIEAVEGAALPVDRAFRARAALDNYYPDMDVETSSFDSFLDTLTDDCDCTVPENLVDVLKPWQVGGFNRLQQSYHLGLSGLLLADGMGLGKTIQTIAHISAIARDVGEGHGRPIALVIAPSTLAFNWVHEFAQFAPQLSVLRIMGPAKNRRQQMLTAAAESYDVVVTSYDYYRRDYAFCKEAGWNLEVLVIDEAQYIKNGSAKRSRAVKTIRAKHNIALTGTPIENSIDDALSIFEFVVGPEANYLGNRSQFLEMRREIRAGYEDSTSFFQQLVKPYTLRRTTQLLGLPPLTQSNLYVEMDPESQAVYRLVNQELIDLLREMSDEQFKDERLMILTKLLRLRQCAFDTSLTGVERSTGPSAKVEALVDMLAEAKERGEKALVFTDMVSGFGSVCGALDDAHVSHMVLTGSTPLDARERIVDRFNSEDDDTVALLAGLKTSGLGLNIVGPQGDDCMPLTTVIHVTPWWNPAARDQATARAYRLGQGHEVHEVNLISADTIEERICLIQKDKELLSENIFGSSELERVSLTREELLELLCAPLN